jgi:uncharacterized membrane protein
VKLPFATESGRVEAFSDGVLAVIITIMVLDLRPPRGATFAALRDDLPTFLAYVLSFVFVGIYWNNHHHMLRASRGVDGRAMWANLHLLFWLSLVPFTTAWLGAHPLAPMPTALYGLDLLLCAIAYSVLAQTLRRVNGPSTTFAAAVGSDRKGNLSLVLYVVAVAAAFVAPLVSCALYVAVAVMWLVPDRRFEPIIKIADRAS